MKFNRVNRVNYQEAVKIIAKNIELLFSIKNVKFEDISKKQYVKLNDEYDICINIYDEVLITGDFGKFYHMIIDQKNYELLLKTINAENFEHMLNFI